MLGAFRYLSDDGLYWQMTMNVELAKPGAGDLTPGTNEPPFPGLWLPRAMLCMRINPSTAPLLLNVICNPDNSAWQVGLNAIVTVFGEPYKVISLNGEKRDAI